jgi:hypothetical protein
MSRGEWRTQCSDSGTTLERRHSRSSHCRRQCRFQYHGEETICHPSLWCTHAAWRTLSLRCHNASPQNVDQPRSERQLSNKSLEPTNIRFPFAFSLLIFFSLFSGVLFAQDSAKGKSSTEVSFSKDVAPVLGKFCTTCHSAEDEHPSELFMDSYESLMKGGKHGRAILPGNSRESLLSQKMSDDPPFGKIMPPPRKPQPTL